MPLSGSKRPKIERGSAAALEDSLKHLRQRRAEAESQLTAADARVR